MKRIICFVLLLFCFPCFVLADSCNGDEKERIQKFANNITTTIEEAIDAEGNITFNVTFSGVSNELRIFKDNTSNYYTNYNDYIDSVTVYGLTQGSTHIFKVYGKDVCVFNNIRNITINLPVYNRYYNEAICAEARDYRLCQKWVEVDVSYEEFAELVNKHIAEQKKDNINDNQITKNLFFEFYQKYYWVCMGALILFLILLIYLWIKENKKNKL